MNRRRTTLPILLTLLAVPFGAGAHDFWLVPDAFGLTPTQDIVVRGQTSTRPHQRVGGHRRSRHQRPCDRRRW